jgi:hypothetical protein
VLRGNRWIWVHPAELSPDDVDCTDMDDKAFAEFVEKVS